MLTTEQIKALPDPERLAYYDRHLSAALAKVEAERTELERSFNVAKSNHEITLADLLRADREGGDARVLVHDLRAALARGKEDGEALRANLALANRERDEATALERKYAELFENREDRLCAEIKDLKTALEDALKFITEGEPSAPDTYRMNSTQEEKSKDDYHDERVKRRTEESKIVQLIESVLSAARTQNLNPQEGRLKAELDRLAMSRDYHAQDANKWAVEAHGNKALVASLRTQLEEARKEVERLLGLRKSLHDSCQKRVDDWVVIADKERVRAEIAESDLTAARQQAETRGDCCECKWTNTGLSNLGEHGKPRWVCQGCAKRAIDERDTLRQQAETDKATIELAMREAVRLATVIYRSEYLRDAPNWKPLDTIAGVISQIDNMYAGIREQRDEARSQLTQRDETIELQLREVKESRKRIAALLALRDQGCWIWQGDGKDELASLGCHIVIHANQLRSLIESSEKKAAKCAVGLALAQCDNDLIALKAQLTQREKEAEGMRRALPWIDQPNLNGWWLWRERGRSHEERLLLVADGACVASDDEWGQAMGKPAEDEERGINYNYWEGTDTTQKMMPGQWKFDAALAPTTGGTEA